MLSSERRGREQQDNLHLSANNRDKSSVGLKLAVTLLVTAERALVQFGEMDPGHWLIYLLVD